MIPLHTPSARSRDNVKRKAEALSLPIELRNCRRSTDLVRGSKRERKGNKKNKMKNKKKRRRKGEPGEERRNARDEIAGREINTDGLHNRNASADDVRLCSEGNSMALHQ